jgi:hypothetical protein
LADDYRETAQSKLDEEKTHTKETEFNLMQMIDRMKIVNLEN